MTPWQKNSTALVVLLSSFTLCLAIALLVRCATRVPTDAGIDDTPPTLDISATPSDTPTKPPTLTPPPSATVVAVSSPLPATGTAVLPSGVTGTAVPPSLTPTSATATAAATPTFAATAVPSSYTVQPDDNLSWISEGLWGYQDWRCLYLANEATVKRPDYIFAGQVLVVPEPCKGQ